MGYTAYGLVLLATSLYLGMAEESCSAGDDCVITRGNALAQTRVRVFHSRLNSHAFGETNEEDDNVTAPPVTETRPEPERESEPEKESEPESEPEPKPEPKPEPEKGSEPESEPEPEPEPEPKPGPMNPGKRSDADDSQFLMQATFGPTRAGLTELKQTTYASWIKSQQSLPMEGHREYYRKRVNPYPDARASGVAVSPENPCAAGSRWHEYTFTAADVGKQVEVKGVSQIFVDGKHRTDIPGGQLPSRWVGLKDYNGFLCFAAERVGGEVHLGRTNDVRRCHGRVLMQNPPIWLQNAAPKATSGKFMKPGVIILQSDYSPCLQNTSFIQLNGRTYHFEDRIQLADNTHANPARANKACAPRTFFNAKHCKLPDFNAPVKKHPGLKAEMFDTRGMDKGYPTDMKYTTAAKTTIVAQVNFPNTGGSFQGFDLRDQFSFRFSGDITIKKAGKYELYLASDDGSRLWIDDALVVTNDGWHGMSPERTGSKDLNAGDHKVRIEHYEGWGGAGIEFRWKGPDTGDKKEMVPQSVLSAMSSYEGCLHACGSPGEVASDPLVGFQFPMWMDDDRNALDMRLDNKYIDRYHVELSKASVWAMKALQAKDQLRQRSAWALSQIIVASTQGIGMNDRTETWLNYYDIFVRNAFGNYRDILEEVTYSPLMGTYLTHTGSSSFDYNNKLPNENYAREIMQLFSIGVDKLHPDGSVKRGAKGEALSSYSNDNIMNFARVFTGFREQTSRGNVENIEGNKIDPMKINVEMHDVHPKPDLDGNYLGDGYQLCNDEGRNFAHLRKGAVYDFHETAAGTPLKVGPLLFQELCGSAPNNSTSCDYKSQVILSRDLKCVGAECEVPSVEFVQVGKFFYKYVPEHCVHMLFEQPKSMQAEAPAPVNAPLFCIGSGDGASDSTVQDGDDKEALAKCTAACTNAGGVGCVWSPFNRGCYMCELGASFTALPKGSGGCPPGTEVTSDEDCKKALTSLGMTIGSNPWIGQGDWLPVGCSSDGNRMHWNFHGSGRGHGNLAPICKTHVVVRPDDGALILGKGTPVPLQWKDDKYPTGGAPAAHLISPRMQAVFTQVPTAAEVATLKIGAPKPSQVCQVCTGDVKVYGPSNSSLNTKTVFEVNGKFYLNAEGIVVLTTDGKLAFRNPPVFLRSKEDVNAELQVHAEVSSLIDHLFHHSNTPVFVSKRLIQRFATSNPSGRYIRAVGDAFKSGTYDGVVYNGIYGDLAATIAAVLLHPEARIQKTGQATTVDGALREPFMKFIHMMRSMEYQDKAREQVVFKELQNVIGQFPFQSPTVFNFYRADFELPMPMPMPEPEPESEPEPEPEAESEPEPESEAEPESEMEPEMEPEPEPEGPVVAPEFQIFTPPFFVGYLNGMSSLIHNGVSGHCNTGETLGADVHYIAEGSRQRMCPQGLLSYRQSGDANDMLSELDVLLTGGRLGAKSKATVEAVVADSAPGKRLQVAQQAIAMTAEFNTLGDPLPKEMPRPPPVQSQPTTANGYKAVVMMFMAGGADTFNMIVPQECDLYKEYQSIRTDLTLAPGELIKFSTEGQPCSTFGVHRRFGFLKGLYDKGQAAFIANIGNLVVPIKDVSHFRSGTVQRCHGLFSHSDQQNGAQTLKCQDMGTGAKGTGGRIADALALGTKKFRTTSFSLAGTSIWPQGFATHGEIVDSRLGSGRFQEYERFRYTIDNITAQRHGNVYAEAYASAFLDAIETTEKVGQALSGVQTATGYPINSGLDRQLNQIAKLIRTRDARKAERDFFFLTTGGWDMHSNMKNNLDGKFNEINSALTKFVAEMEAQKIWDKVVFVTESEFARTLDSNGGGSDHAWAGNHFMISGGLNGGRIMNKFPAALQAGNDHDLGRGRMIPEFPWESMMVPLADWLGMDADQEAVTFPNLARFNRTQHIIPTKAMFKEGGSGGDGSSGGEGGGGQGGSGSR